MNTPVSSNTYFLPYFPEISKELGNSHAATIMARMEYWFSKYQDGFYKFLEPCDHPCYRQGDSWSEEIGIARRTFNRAFDLVGVRYKSKSDYMKAVDPFHGKPYASYHDRKTNRTHFVRNPKVMSDFFQRILEFFSNFLKNPKAAGNKLVLKGRSRNGTFGHSYGCANKDKQKNTSSSQNTSTFSTDEKEEEGLEGVKAIELHEENLSKGVNQDRTHSQRNDVEVMCETWTEMIAPLTDVDEKPYVKRMLKKALRESFQSKHQNFKDYCMQIASSKFLMGEEKKAKTFKKVQLRWAIKPETIEKVRGGAFTLGDRKVPMVQKAYGLELEEKSNRLIHELSMGLFDQPNGQSVFQALLQASNPGEFYGAFKNLSALKISSGDAPGIIRIKTLDSFAYFMIDRFLRAHMPREGLKVQSGDTYRIYLEG